MNIPTSGWVWIPDMTGVCYEPDLVHDPRFPMYVEVAGSRNFTSYPLAAVFPTEAHALGALLQALNCQEREAFARADRLRALRRRVEDAFKSHIVPDFGEKPEGCICEPHWCKDSRNGHALRCPLWTESDTKAGGAD